MLMVICAVMGGCREIEVATIDGKAHLQVPAGTQNMDRLRMRSKGVLNARTGQRGDQYVTIK